MKYLYLFLALFSVCFCNRPQENLDFGSTIQSNKLSIFKDSKARLSAGKPFLQNKNFDILTVSSAGKDSSQTLSFTTSLSIQPIVMGINAFPHQNTIIISVSANGLQSKNNGDFIGFEFDSIPNIMSNTTLNTYELSKFVQSEKIESLSSNRNRFFYWKYNDSLFAAVFPLGNTVFQSNFSNPKNAKITLKTQCFNDRKGSPKLDLAIISFDKNLNELLRKMNKISKQSQKL